MALNNIISFGNAKPVELKEEYSYAVQSCRQIILTTLPKLMDALFEKVDDSLYSMADKASTNTLQTSYFEAMRELRLVRENIEDRFNTGVIERYEQFWREGPSCNLADEELFSFTEDDFSLVEHEELEESLAISNMISKGQGMFYRELFALEQRFSHMLSGAEVDEEANPISPKVIAHSFRDAFASVGIDLPVKLLIYKLFEKQVIARLGTMYGQINGFLVNAGIMPRVQGQARRRPNSSAPGQDTSSDYDQLDDDGYQDQEYQGDADAQAELFGTLQNLLNIRRGGEANLGYSAMMPVYDPGQVLSALTSLQHTHGLDQSIDVGATLYDIRTGLATTLREIQAENEERRIDQNDQDAIDVIAMLFEFILEDRNLHEAMRAELACLQIPMLKVAILDKRFFSNKAHPARRLLNSLAQAAVGWSEADGRGEETVYGRISRIVRRVVDEFENDLSLFEELNEEFNSYVVKESKGAEVAESRATQVTQGKEQLSQAKKQVREEINLRLVKHRHIPALVRSFLNEGWKDVLLLIALKQGVDSPEWQSTLALADDLIWSVQPKSGHEERQKLLKLIPLLLKGIRRGLNDISYNQHQMTGLFKELQSYHVRCLRGLDPEPGAEEQPETQVEAEEEAVVSKVTVPEMVDKYDELAGGIEIGTWFEMPLKDQKQARAKLSWRSNVTGTCLFVNRKGMKVAEMTQDGLAKLLREGKAIVIEQTGKPLMDRALDAMLDALHNTGDEASPQEAD
ncbi:MAG: DUF1631 domain-containing protein [Chromatiales bacterium]|nr:DUF1631 domain-containing protein [Chromatiales bacterium]